MRILPTRKRRAEDVVLSELQSGDFVHRDDLIEALWGDDSKGGPLCIQTVLTIYIQRLRRSGYRIDTFFGRGYRLRSVNSGSFL
jgi:DNA-binding response OmpR family regulator